MNIVFKNVLKRKMKDGAQWMGKEDIKDVIKEVTGTTIKTMGSED